MATFTVHEAKTQLSRLLTQAEQGEEVVIARANHPIARLVPITQTKKPKRQLGRLHGRGKRGDEHWAAAEVQALFESS